jgi:DNA-binding HxlR family transcriptional regulator
MLGKTYSDQNCSAARALESVGERWSLLIIRDALFRGVTRFADFQRNLGVASNILASRLNDFVAADLMERRLTSPHHDYLLTDKGRDLQPVIVALTHWGDRWAAPDGPPIVFEHADCGGGIEQHFSCTICGGDIENKSEINAKSGPGARR